MTRLSNNSERKKMERGRKHVDITKTLSTHDYTVRHNGMEGETEREREREREKEREKDRQTEGKEVIIIILSKDEHQLRHHLNLRDILRPQRKEKNPMKGKILYWNSNYLCFFYGSMHGWITDKVHGGGGGGATSDQYIMYPSKRQWYYPMIMINYCLQLDHTEF